LDYLLPSVIFRADDQHVTVSLWFLLPVTCNLHLRTSHNQQSICLIIKVTVPTTRIIFDFQKIKLIKLWIELCMAASNYDEKQVEMKKTNENQWDEIKLSRENFINNWTLIWFNLIWFYVLDRPNSCLNVHQHWKI
jgi:hypothetical protein